MSGFVDVWLAITANDSSSDVLEEPDALEEPAVRKSRLTYIKKKSEAGI